MYRHGKSGFYCREDIDEVTDKSTIDSGSFVAQGEIDRLI